MGKKVKNKIQILLMIFFFILAIILDFVDISYLKDEFQNRMFSKTIQQSCGAIGAILLMKYLNIRLFGRIENTLYLIPCFIIAIDNFQWCSYFNGNMTLVHDKAIDVILFFLYCLSVGLFEELIFRGILFSVIASYFPNNKKGFLMTFVCSSVVFGLAHLLNGNLLQVGYSVLTGGLFAFCLIKTKNILCPALVHGVYNFCGLLFDKQGLGTGVVFDLDTIITMLLISVIIGLFVLYRVWEYPEKEREKLYNKLLDKE